MRVSIQNTKPLLETGNVETSELKKNVDANIKYMIAYKKNGLPW